jgi:hypothetical protein
MIHPSIPKLVMLSLFSKRVLVRAFSTTAVSPRVLLLSSSASSSTSLAFTTAPRRFQFSSTAKGVAGEIDLDEALDSILDEAFEEAGDPRDLEKEAHIKGSHPIPSALIVEVSITNILCTW